MINDPSITIITFLSEKQKHDLTAMYRNEFWCNTRELHDVEEMLCNTDVVIGAENGVGKLVGFVRVLTDYVYKATIYDLIVNPEYRSRGVGRLLMDEIFNHPDLSKVGHFDLNCLPEMIEFYEKWNFSTDVDGLVFMRRFKKD